MSNNTSAEHCGHSMVDDEKRKRTKGTTAETSSVAYSFSFDNIRQN